MHKSERKVCVAINGVRGRDYESIGWPSISRNGRVVAYRVEDGERQFIRIGDRDEPDFDNVSDPVVNADGSVVAYAAESPDGWFVHVNGRRLPVDAFPFNLFISDDGRHVGWIVSESKPDGGSRHRVVANGKKGEAFGIVGRPVFSPVEPLVAYATEEAGRKYVVIGDRKIETPDRMSDPSFSADGRRVGYGARIGQELWWKVIDVR